MIPDYVEFSDAAGEWFGKFISSSTYSQIGFICDENTIRNCYQSFGKAAYSHKVFEIKSGEENKTLETCLSIWDWMTENKFDRNSLIINLGGGVIGDMGGFCAATYKRGIPFIQIPTTLLAQVDASIGGKLGVDFKNYKNHIGVFQLPGKVIIDTSFLQTLHSEDLKSGFAEVVKHAVIRDADEFEKLRALKWSEVDDWQPIVMHSVNIKGDIVESDPREQGPRKLLNFGHTIGHAVESYYLQSKERSLLHGEAVALGMICESYLSYIKLGLPEDQLHSIVKYLLEIYKKVDLEEMERDDFLKYLSQDKKNKGNTIICTLLKEIGKAEFDISISSEEAIKSLEFYQEQSH